MSENISDLKEDFEYKNELVRLASAVSANVSAAASAGYSKAVMQFFQNAKHALNEAETLVGVINRSEAPENFDLNRIEELLSICRKNLYSEIKRTAMHIC